MAFVFFTNYKVEKKKKKGKEKNLRFSGKSFFNILWQKLERPSGDKGNGHQIAESESDEYFFSSRSN